MRYKTSLIFALSTLLIATAWPQLALAAHQITTFDAPGASTASGQGTPAQQGGTNSLAYPQDSQPFGMTYGDWQAAYIQYAFSIAASTNPISDTTGEYCQVAQSSGPVFYLNSAFIGALVTRSCTVPASKALLVPIAGWECSSVEPPPSYGANPQDMRTCAAAAIDGVDPAKLKVTVDGASIHGLKAFRAQSPFFTFATPAHDNILGLDGVTSASSVSDGYLVMLKPLSHGDHVVHLEGAFVSGPGAPGTFGVTYYLTVQ
jgi:hypothetical protein